MVPTLDALSLMGHEHLAYFNMKEFGLRAIIAIHHTGRGPAFGGCRMYPYASDAAALWDVLRLSRGMTYKSAILGLNFGGGKSVIIGDPRVHKSKELLKAMGRAVHSLGGRYIMSEDVGTTVRDLDVVRTVTPFVLGRDMGNGDPCPATAYGVFQGIRAAARHRLGRADLAGITVAVQGLGSVGYTLCRYLSEAGAALLVSDIRPEAVARVVSEFGATAVPAGEILFVACDILSPNALGAVFDDETIPKLRCGAIAGAANNQLAAERHGEALHRRGILYTPDYVANSGGVIDVAHEGPGYDPRGVLKDCERIYDVALDVFARAEREHLPANVVADRMAEARFHHHARAGAPPDRASATDVPAGVARAGAGPGAGVASSQSASLRLCI